MRDGLPFVLWANTIRIHTDDMVQMALGMMGFATTQKLLGPKARRAKSPALAVAWGKHATCLEIRAMAKEIGAYSSLRPPHSDFCPTPAGHVGNAGKPAVMPPCAPGRPAETRV
jgi:hypothetical protein